MVLNFAGKGHSHSYIFCWTCWHNRGGYFDRFSIIAIFLHLYNFRHLSFSPVLCFAVFIFSLYQVLRQKLHRSFKNVKIVSNRMVFDENGRLVSFKGSMTNPSHILNRRVIYSVPLHWKNASFVRKVSCLMILS